MKRGPKGPSKYTAEYLEELRPKVNFYLHTANLSRESTAKHLRINPTVVGKLEMSRSDWEKWETSHAKCDGNSRTDEAEGNRGVKIPDCESAAFIGQQSESDIDIPPGD